MSIGGFNITVDWFKKQTKDLLFQKQVPKYNGGGTYWVNQGKLNNTGVECEIQTLDLLNRHFRHHIGRTCFPEIWQCIA